MVDIHTFFYKLTVLELYTLIEALPYVDRIQRETSRITALFIAQKMNPKRLKLTDLYPLPWDHDNDGEVTDMKEYMNAMKKIQNALNNKNETDIQQQES